MASQDNIDYGYDSELLLINQKVIPYLRNLGYDRIERNFIINLGNRTIEIDAVIFLDSDKKEPFIVV